MINIIEELKTNTGLVAILSLLISSLANIFILNYTQTKENERLKINKNLELEKHKQSEIFGYKKEIYSLIYNNLFEIAQYMRKSPITVDIQKEVENKYFELIKNYNKVHFYMGDELRSEMDVVSGDILGFKNTPVKDINIDIREYKNKLIVYVRPICDNKIFKLMKQELEG